MLYRRQGIDRYLRQVPKALREVIGRCEIKVNLGTTDLETAKRKLAIEALKADRLFAEARRILSTLTLARSMRLPVALVGECSIPLRRTSPASIHGSYSAYAGPRVEPRAEGRQGVVAGRV